MKIKGSDIKDKLKVLRDNEVVVGLCVLTTFNIKEIHWGNKV